MKVQNHSISHQHSKESSRARRGQSYTRPAAYTSLVVHVRSGEKGEAVGETGCGEMVSVAAASESVRKHQCSRLYGELMEILRCTW